MRYPYVSLICCCCLFLFVSACGKSDAPETVLVEGTVTFDGQPLETGSILFVDPSGQDKDWAGKIINGQFSFPSTVGQKEVSIVSEKQVENPQGGVPGTIGDPPGPNNPIVVVTSVIPTKYNDPKQSGLIANVTSAGPNVFNFELKSNP